MKAIFKYVSCLALIGLCTQVMAHTIEERLSELEQQMEEVGTTNPEGTFGAGFTNAGTEGQNGWYLMVEPLYWHAKVGATEYAYTDRDRQSDLGSILLPPLNGRVKDQGFGWEWGLRLGLGRYFSHDDWDVKLTYTWYQADDSTSVFKREPSSVISLRIADIAPFSHAKSHYDLNYNNVNVELGREYFMSSKVSVRPQIGVKSSWIYEKQQVHYTLPQIPDFDGSGHIVKVKDKDILWGIGPRMGVMVNGYIGDGFSLYASLDGALLYSYSRASYVMHADANATTIGDDFRIHLRSKSHLFMPNVQAMLGIIWETYINEKRQHITLGAGYEAEYFWRANQALMVDDTFAPNFVTPAKRFAVERASEDVMFYGLTLKARLDF